MKIFRWQYNLFILPALLVMVIFFVYPVFLTFYFSFLDYSIVRHTKEFIGLGNYIKIFKSNIFIQTAYNTFIWVVISTFVPLFLSILAALLTYEGFLGYRIFRSLFSLPMIFIPSSTAILWALMYSEPFGLINHIMEFLHLPREIWLANPKTVLPAVSIANTWYGTPMSYLMILAGLESLDIEPLEASEVDGASYWQKVRYVILPMVSPVILLVGLLRLIDVIRSFSLIWIMTQGGPGTSSTTLPVATFKVSFLQYDYGMGSAWGVINVIVTFVITLLILRRQRG